MLTTTSPGPGLLFFSFLYRADLFSYELFEDRIKSLFGDCMRFKPLFNPLTQYYEKEMGEGLPLERYFFVATSPLPREFLLSTKLLSLDWEKEWSVDGKRHVNVDIGFIAPENFILATTKSFSHRIYLGQNIYGDLTYLTQSSTYSLLPWTYPDYKDQEKLDFFNWCRSFLLQSI
jgi:hypothetical protein